MTQNSSGCVCDSRAASEAKLGVRNRNYCGCHGYAILVLGEPVDYRPDRVLHIGFLAAASTSLDIRYEPTTLREVEGAGQFRVFFDAFDRF